MTDPNDGVPPADVISHADVILRGQEVLAAGRLREAAGLFSTSAIIATLEGDQPNADIWRHSAALLRSIADVGQWRTDLTTGDRWGVPWDVWRAAHALADTVLGGSA